MLAVFVYGEPQHAEKMLTFGLIWTALAILAFYSLQNLCRMR